MYYSIFILRHYFDHYINELSFCDLTEADKCKANKNAATMLNALGGLGSVW
jgi:hypothetical protein